MNGRKQIKANLKKAKQLINKLKKVIRQQEEKLVSLKLENQRRLEEEKLEAQKLRFQLTSKEEEIIYLEEVIKRVKYWYQIIIWK